MKLDRFFCLILVSFAIFIHFLKTGGNPSSIISPLTLSFSLSFFNSLSLSASLYPTLPVYISPCPTLSLSLSPFYPAIFIYLPIYLYTRSLTLSLVLNFISLTQLILGCSDKKKGEYCSCL